MAGIRAYRSILSGVNLQIANGTTAANYPAIVQFVVLPKTTTGIGGYHVVV